MMKKLVYFVGLLITFIFISGCETKNYFIDRGSKVHPAEKETVAPQKVSLNSVAHCAKTNRAELVACLSPNRRVEIKSSINLTSIEGANNV